MLDYSKVKAVDEAVYKAMMDELDRQETHVELIASENFVSEAVMNAMGSHLTNKYAEGYPGKRYYGGCEFVDVAEMEPSMSMSSLTRARRPTRRFILPC